MSLSMPAFCESTGKNNVYGNTYLHVSLIGLKIKMQKNLWSVCLLYNSRSAHFLVFQTKHTIANIMNKNLLLLVVPLLPN